MSLTRWRVLFTKKARHEHVAAVLAAVTEHATTDRERRALNEGATNVN